MDEVDTVMVLATNNPGKVAEFRKLLEGLPIQLLGVADALGAMPPVVEDGETFEQNATKKARAAADAALMLTLADDSGLEVTALQGAPGVRSARYAGERATDAENNAALLEALKEVPSEDRQAQFRCVLCLIDPWAGEEPSVVTVEGICRGRIARSPQGSGGFGYDPLFILEEGDGRTLAELSAEEKNAVSHRSRAVAALRPKLLKLLEDRAEATERISMIAPIPE